MHRHRCRHDSVMKFGDKNTETHCKYEFHAQNSMEKMHDTKM